MKNSPRSRYVLFVALCLIALLAVVAVPGRMRALVTPRYDADGREVHPAEARGGDSAGAVGGDLPDGMARIRLNPVPTQIPGVTVHDPEDDPMESSDAKKKREQARREAKGL